MPEAVIVSTARSPIGRAFKGSLKDVRPDDLAAAVVTAALEKVPALDPATGRRPLPRLRRAVGRARLQHGPRGGRAGRLRPPARAPRSTASAPRRCRPPGWRSTRSGPVRATSSSAPASRRCPATSTSPAPAGPRPTGRTRGSPRRRPQRPDRGGQHALDRSPRGRPAARHLPRDGPDRRERRRPARRLPRAPGRVGRLEPEPRREGHRRRVLRPRDHADHHARRHGRQHRRRPPPGGDAGEGVHPEPGVPRAGHDHRGQLLPAQRRRRRPRGDERHQGRRAGPDAARPGRLHRRQRPLPRDHGPRPGRGLPPGAGPRRA